MVTFRFNKLVRNNIWRWHEESGHTVAGKRLSGKELSSALVRKLHEEADEVASANNMDEFTEELADVQQLVDELAAVHGISIGAVRDAQQKKLQKKGGFSDGLFIETVSMPSEDDIWAQYCRQAPNKYPEVDIKSGRSDVVMPEFDAGEYVHKKSGKRYNAIGLGLHTETDQPMVIYTPLYDSAYKYFIRPHEMFTGKVLVAGGEFSRFEKVSGGEETAFDTIKNSKT